MHILHLHKENYKVSQWSGGTTTEVFIWPEGADYASRDFSLRISSATVELEESDFTTLPGVIRWIVPLQGGFTLTHPDTEPVVLAPLDPPYRFSGEVATHCVGCATDFNLMLKGVAGRMDICRETAPVSPGLNCLYAAEDCTISIDNMRYQLVTGESLVVFSEDAYSAILSGGAVIRCYATL